MNLTKITAAVLILTALCIVLIVVNHLAISHKYSASIFSNIALLPKHKTILVFGAGRNYGGRMVNFWFNGRMHAAEKSAYFLQPQKIILSGRSDQQEYREAHDMQDELIKRGVNPVLLHLDTLGNNTFNSMFNLSKSPHSDTVILISQHGQLERALFYAEEFDINAVGYAADGRRAKGFFAVREVLARVKARIDVLFN